MVSDKVIKKIESTPQASINKQEQIALFRKNAAELQRQNQQGLGRGIESTVIDGNRNITVNNQFIKIPHTKTFYDFLDLFIQWLLGVEWGVNEEKKAISQRHPILKWHQAICNQRIQHKAEDEPKYRMPKTGALKVYFGLAYDLYTLQHNGLLTSGLLDRLKRNDLNFSGAYYEVNIAAMLVRAGFKLEFEDESDKASSHCEFTAVSIKTGSQFSVECKRIESLQADGLINYKNIVKNFTKALKKKVNHERIVFIDLNFPFYNKQIVKLPNKLKLALNRIERLEQNQNNSTHLPPCFIFYTNAPYAYSLDEESVPMVMTVDSFKIPEFKDVGVLGLYNNYPDIAHILDSLERYSYIPSTFDGELPAYAYNNNLNESRLLIGNWYAVPANDGNEVEAELVDARFSERDNIVFLQLKTEDGSELEARCKLSGLEIEAYKSAPDTFFGKVILTNNSVHNNFGTYNFFYNIYKGTQKDKLLEYCKHLPNFDELTKLSQSELAKRYAEHCAESAIL